MNITLDKADFLDSAEAVRAFIEDAIAEDDPQIISRAFEIAARAVRRLGLVPRDSRV